jgi:hypothetical protein
MNALSTGVEFTNGDERGVRLSKFTPQPDSAQAGHRETTRPLITIGFWVAHPKDSLVAQHCACATATCRFPF